MRVKQIRGARDFFSWETGWYRGYIFVPVMFMTGVFIAFKEPRPKVAGEFKDIGADGAKARSTLLSKEVVMKQSFETSNCIMVFLFLSWVIRIRPMVIM